MVRPYRVSAFVDVSACGAADAQLEAPRLFLRGQGRPRDLHLPEAYLKAELDVFRDQYDV